MIMRRFVSLFLIGLLLSVTFATPLTASACGGFFCRNTPISQTAERIIFAVDTKNRMITSVVGINYTGDAAEFSWVVPVPSVPELDVAETKSLDHLADATNLVFNFPDNPCMVVMSANAQGGGGDTQPVPGAPPFLKTGQVGPFDYAIIRNEKPDAMVAWLRENKYQVTPEMEPLVNQYVKEGQYFLAMKLQRGKEISEIKPVVMRYTGVDPAIPIRLTAVASVPNLQLLVWVLGSVQYVPQNYAHPEVDYSRMRAGFVQVQESGSSFLSLQTYQDERRFYQEKYQGKAFVTEYAQPMNVLLKDTRLTDKEGLDPVLTKLFSQYAYVTRLRGQMNPDQMTLDPVFTADPNAKDVTNLIDLNKFVNGKTFWRCNG
jgi:hypothetical protein